MKITYDPNKNQRNIEERQLSFEEVHNFEWKTALIWQDIRVNYPEPRFNTLGFIDKRIYSVTFTPTADGIRVISFRKANRREVKKYEQERGL